MTTAIRIGLLSVAMAVYMAWAFRGIEYDALEAGPALLGMILAFTGATIIAVPLYKWLSQRSGEDLARFAFNFWAVTAGIAVVAWLVLYGRDAAAGGYFRDNLIVGVIGLIALVAILNLLLLRALRYFAPRRR